VPIVLLLKNLKGMQRIKKEFKLVVFNYQKLQACTILKSKYLAMPRLA
jgi:hypothetical protein